MMNQVFAVLVDTSHLPKAQSGSLDPILNAIFVFMGALALLMVVIGGFRYAISGGDSEKVANSKRMITYSIVGLVVIALAAVIVNYIIGII
ncbi:MAG TPA: pilin [Candidatus Saccharimonadales bacterium]|nr:pilin [Candidatus Saccharimonadales bacterium]